MIEDHNDHNAQCLELIKHPGVRAIVIPVDLLQHISIDNGKLVVQLKCEEEYRACQRNTASATLSIHRIKRKITDWFARRHHRG